MKALKVDFKALLLMRCFRQIWSMIVLKLSTTIKYKMNGIKRKISTQLERSQTGSRIRLTFQLHPQPPLRMNTIPLQISKMRTLISMIHHLFLIAMLLPNLTELLDNPFPETNSRIIKIPMNMIFILQRRRVESPKGTKIAWPQNKLHPMCPMTYPIIFLWTSILLTPSKSWWILACLSLTLQGWLLKIQKCSYKKRWTVYSLALMWIKSLSEPQFKQIDQSELEILIGQEVLFKQNSSFYMYLGYFYNRNLPFQRNQWRKILDQVTSSRRRKDHKP